MEVDEGGDGRTYPREPMPLGGYYKLPEKSEPSAGGEWFINGELTGTTGRCLGRE